MNVLIDNESDLDFPLQQALAQMQVGINAGWGIEHEGRTGGHRDVTVRTMGVRADAVLTPTQIALATNNYDPPGLSTATVLRLSTDTSRNLTGLKAPAASERAASRWVLVVNAGAQNIVLVDESTSSDVANRFACPGSANLTLNGDDSVWLWYDRASMRWRPIGV